MLNLEMTAKMTILADLIDMLLFFSFNDVWGKYYR